MSFNAEQLKLIEQMASWRAPEHLCNRCVGMGACHLLEDLIKGNPRQQEDLKESTAMTFAADCTLNDVPDHVDIFDMLEKLNSLG